VEEKPLAGDGDGRCFDIKRVVLESLTGDPVPMRNKLQEAAARARDKCYALGDIKALQKRLGNLLLEDGYVTSRVLMPEQSLADGKLTLLVLAGRLSAIESRQLKPALVDRALPGTRGDVLQLSAMEQAVENLNRLPGVETSLDIKPGEKTGESVLVAESRRTAPVAASFLANQKYYGSTAHGTARASLETMTPMPVPDRMILSINTDTDQEKSDTAWGAGFDYDVGLGYWLFNAGYNRQAYDNEVDGTFNEGLLELEPEPASTAEDDTTTWSVVARFPEVWFELPFGMDLTAHYYEAESFQPAGISNNIIGQPLASPFGETEEYGFTLSLMDNRLAIRFNKFETSNANARTGNMNGQLPQIANRIQFFLDRITSAENDATTGLFPD